MNKEAYYAEKYLKMFTNTKLLSKLEKQLKEDEQGVLMYAVSAYLYYSKKEFDPEDYPELNKQKLLFLEALQNPKTPGKNKYLDANNAVKGLLKEKINREERNNRMRQALVKEMKEKGLSLNSVCKKTNVPYSNAYNFLYKNQNKLSTFNQLELLRKIREK